jgi:hypothetical protein
MNRALRLIKLVEKGTETFIINVRERDPDSAYKKVVSNQSIIKGGKLLAQKNKIVVFKDLWNRPIGQLLDGIHDMLNDDPRFENPEDSPAGCIQVKPGDFVFFGIGST